MANLCKIMVIGNVGTDPEMRYTPQGTPVTTFRLATTRNITGPDGQRQRETEWFSVICWRQLAEQCNQYLTKGRRAYVEGRFRSRSWTGPDGSPRFRNEIVADRVIFLDRGQPPVVEPPPEHPSTEEGLGNAEEEAENAEDLPW